jgi:hypothetical protein
MIRRRLISAATLACLVVLLCVMALWGYRAATAPLSDTSSDTPTNDPGCAAADQTVTKYVRRADVTVSVYNSGQQSGRAQATMDLFEQAGFRVGAVDNAPSALKAARAVVYTTKTDDPAADLVALALGHSAQVVHTDEEYGPGVDVVIGDKFKQLDPAAPKRLELPEPVISCK